MADTQQVDTVRFQQNRCENIPAALRNREYWACSSELGHLREARSLFGSGIKKSSDSITQLGETVPRLEGDDSWNTCRGSAWWGGGPDPATSSRKERGVEPAWGFLPKLSTYTVEPTKHGSVLSDTKVESPAKCCAETWRTPPNWSGCRSNSSIKT